MVKTFKRFLLVLTAFSFVNLGVFAEEKNNEEIVSESVAKEDDEVMKNALGASVMFNFTDLGVGGIQYMHRFNDIFSLENNLLLYSGPGEADNTDFGFYYSAQMDFSLYKFKAATSKIKFESELYAWLLLGYMGYTQYNYVAEDDAYDYRVLDDYFSSNFVFGFGFAFDFVLFEHLSIPLQLGYLGKLPDMNINFCIGTGVRYLF